MDAALQSRRWLAIIGWWEVLIGLTFLAAETSRIAIALLAMQMAGTFLPLVMLPAVTFQPGTSPTRRRSKASTSSRTC